MSVLPEEKDILKAGEKPEELEVVIEGEEAPIVEIVDDTPPEDRNRKPVPEGEAEPSEEEMEQYSEAVKKRIAKMKHSIHDERRAKESAIREREAAISMAKKAWEDKKQMEQRYRFGEDAFINQAKEKTELSMADAKRSFKQAYELGDADAMADAQEKMSLVALEKRQAEEWVRQSAIRKETAGQEEEAMVQSTQSSQGAVPEPDPVASDWAAKNKWFGQNKVMTAAAYGVHDELIEQGLDPKTDSTEYYQKVNTRMREVFPNHEWGDTPKKKSIASVVAPVNRTSKTATRVTLTQSQVSVARRLGLTSQQYAVELAKLEN